ncbi:MAG: leucyl aminopeptidase [Phycisphaerales bacterium]|nr:leucyl aminopeptidase [Phycisphaerales bacterium]
MPQNGTTFEFVGLQKSDAPDVLIVPLASKPAPALERLAHADRLCGGAVSSLCRAAPPGDEPGQIIHTAAGGAIPRVILVSLGSAERLDPARVRSAAASAARWLIAERIRSAALWVDGLLSAPEDGVCEWIVGMALAGFRFDEMRTPESKAPPRVRVQLAATADGFERGARAAIRAALTEAGCVNYARRLAHLPANVIQPQSLAAEARRLARECGLKCEIVQQPALERLRMGGLLAVGRGSKVRPCLIRLEHRGAPRSNVTHVLVGKAITFDTGGYSIKPNDNMITMKYDKSGGCAVLGVMRACAQLKLRCNVIALIAAAENMISHDAYRPGDILTMMSGKTVEIISTDAEGRLVLGDALWYAQTRLNPATLIDIATLTGGVRTTFGTAAAGLMGNDDELAADLGEAGRRMHERLWRLPLWDDYRELIKSHDADIRNSAGRPEAHAIVGGMFLQEFVKPKTAWAHLDIAAVANRDDPKLPTGRGASGFGVRLLIEFLRRRSA